MIHIMIDLETLGRPPSPALLAVGAVVIRNGEIGATFHQHVNPDSSITAGGSVSGETVLWWLNQSDEARQAITSASKINEKAVMESFVAWFKKHVGRSQVSVWGNGATFDISGLESALTRHGIEVPWQFWQVRCYRTLKSLLPSVKLGENTLAHDALSDALAQGEHLVRLLAALKESDK